MYFIPKAINLIRGRDILYPLETRSVGLDMPDKTY
jgi:hypothetical protein